MVALTVATALSVIRLTQQPKAFDGVPNADEIRRVDRGERVIHPDLIAAAAETRNR